MKPRIPKSKYRSRTEQDYAATLQYLKLADGIIDWQYEPIRLSLGGGAWYKPDFLVVKEDGFEFHEVKGHWREAAKVRIKVASEKHPYFRFMAVQRGKNGKWIYQEF